MKKPEKRNFQIAIFIFFIVSLITVFLFTIAYKDTLLEMFAWTFSLLTGFLIALFLLIMPLETLIAYFAISPTLGMLNNIKLQIPGSKAAIAFGGIIQSVILIFGALACIRKKNKIWHHSKYIQLIFIFFLLWIFLSIIINIGSLDITRSLKEFGRLASIYVIFLLCLKYADRIANIKKFTVALYISLIVPIGLAIYQLFAMDPDIEGYRRITGTFGIPNMFAMYLVLPTLVILMLSINEKFRFKLLSWPLFFFLLIILFFTYTRASWLAFLTGVLYIGTTRYKRILIFLIITILILIPLFSAEGLRLGKSGSSGRIGLWKALFPASLSAPLFGHGLTKIGDISKLRVGGLSSGQNEYFLYLIEAGFFALAALILLLTFFYKKYSYAIVLLHNGIYKDIAIAYKAYFIGICLIAFFESNAIFQNWIWLPGGIFLSASLNSLRESPQSPPSYIKD